ncbi:DEAD/DEAH box helicase family protein [Sphingomonas sp. KRR8]|uniref:DEAD/DEAH box helicase family protein n=1 Tax=Sphingomonas sp. KRR8 TaxID=2942996 RepID=UPI0024C4CDD8|nr:DEAD/DEAH box helicase family protein [Sphingomonas sp. KRR8]
MSRRFSERQKRNLCARSAGKCQLCGEKIAADFHADHRLPVFLGGPTILKNGQATCSDCNLKKGKKMLNNLRKWQMTAVDQAIVYLTQKGGKHFVVNAAPGAGKTKLACVIAMILLTMKLITRVVVIAPRTTVVDQWAKEFSHVTGRRMEKITAADGRWIPNTDYCATWNAVKGLQDVFQSVCEGGRTLVICDEHHHAAIEAAWGASADSAFKNAAYCLVLTGTPVRSDGGQSVWLDLDKSGRIKHAKEGMVTLTYGEAVKLGYCRPVAFHRHRGQFTVELNKSQSVVVASDADPVLPPGLEVDRILKPLLEFDRLARTRSYEPDGVTPRVDSYQATMVAQASEKLNQVQIDMPEAGGLVIAPSIDMANYFADLIERIDGEKPLVVHSDTRNADRRIETFRHKEDIRWLVSVGMVAEGVDIPRLRVLIYLPKAMTELAFRQAVGRVVRNYGHNDQSCAYVIMPGTERFDSYARRIEDDMPAITAPSESEQREKVCRHCHCRNDLGAATCHDCGTDFPSREVAFAPCDCGFLNKVGAAYCLDCGKDLLQAYDITLDEAARDGIISRGVKLPEEDVREAEALSEATRELIRRAETHDKVLAATLSSFPLELVSLIARSIKDTGFGEPATE